MSGELESRFTGRRSLFHRSIVPKPLMPTAPFIHDGAIGMRDLDVMLLSTAVCQLDHSNVGIRQAVAGPMLHYVAAAWDPFHKHGLILFPAWISNHMPSKVRMKTYPLPNFNGDTFEWISNFISHVMTDVITIWDYRYTTYLVWNDLVPLTTDGSAWRWRHIGSRPSVTVNPIRQRHLCLIGHPVSTQNLGGYFS